MNDFVIDGIVENLTFSSANIRHLLLSAKQSWHQIHRWNLPLNKTMQRYIIWHCILSFCLLTYL